MKIKTISHQEAFLVCLKHTDKQFPFEEDIAEIAEQKFCQVLFEKRAKK